MVTITHLRLAMSTDRPSVMSSGKKKGLKKMGGGEGVGGGRGGVEAGRVKGERAVEMEESK
jgi:hypothetical protein